MKLTPSPLTSRDLSRLAAADGRALACIGTIGLTLTIQGLKIPQKFTVVKNLTYKLILGLDFMQNMQASIDFGHNTLSICDDLVIEPLLAEKLPTNVMRVAFNCTIPPLSEAVIAMTSDKPYNGQFLLTPLPTSFRKHISLAHAVVNIHNRKTQCRILNPTHSPVSLNKRTVLATVTPISNSQIFAYDKSHETPPVPTVNFASQLKTLNDLGIDVSATAYTQPQKEQVVAFVYNNRDLFASDISELPGIDVVTHTIHTGDTVPIRQRAYRHSPAARKEIDRQIDHLLKSDIIEVCDSQWSSPVVLVKKKGGSHRLCIDMRKVNSVTKPVFFLYLC